MSEWFRDLIAGRHDGDLLQNSRFEGLGTQAYGAEDITALLRQAAIDTSASLAFADEGAAVLIDDGFAAFADRQAGRTTRLWLLGSMRLGRPLPALSVPSDPDCDQRGPAPLGSAAYDQHHGKEIQQGWLLLRTDPRLFSLRRPRAMLVRALVVNDDRAALLRVEGLAANGRAGCYALIHDSGTLLDEAGLAAALEQPWTPALRN